jgi:hypothetical protein
VPAEKSASPRARAEYDWEAFHHAIHDLTENCADPTSFESWRQAFIDRHGHDMSVEQEKKLRAKVDKVIDAYEQEHVASRKLCEKIDEIGQLFYTSASRVLNTRGTHSAFRRLAVGERVVVMRQTQEHPRRS